MPLTKRVGMTHQMSAASVYTLEVAYPEGQCKTSEIC